MLLWFLLTQRSKSLLRDWHRRLPVPLNAPPPLARLLRACWQEDPAARPAFKDILSVLKARRTHLCMLLPLVLLHLPPHWALGTSSKGLL